MSILKNLWALILLFGANTLTAQSVARHTFSSSGGEIASGNTTLSFTIGEPIVGTISSGGTALGQGFWAGVAASESLDISTFEKDLYGIAVYPNPVNELLFLKYPERANLNARVVDLNGRTLLRKNLSTNQDQLDLSILSSGNYLILISAEDGTQKTFKIIKN